MLCFRGLKREVDGGNSHLFHLLTNQRSIQHTYLITLLVKNKCQKVRQSQLTDAVLIEGHKLREEWSVEHRDNDCVLYSDFLEDLIEVFGWRGIAIGILVDHLLVLLLQRHRVVTGHWEDSWTKWGIDVKRG